MSSKPQPAGNLAGWPSLLSSPRTYLHLAGWLAGAREGAGWSSWNPQVGVKLPRSPVPGPLPLSANCQTAAGARGVGGHPPTATSTLGWCAIFNLMAPNGQPLSSGPEALRRLGVKEKLGRRCCHRRRLERLAPAGPGTPGRPLRLDIDFSPSYVYKPICYRTVLIGFHV